MVTTHPELPDTPQNLPTTEEVVVQAQESLEEMWLPKEKRIGKKLPPGRVGQREEDNGSKLYVVYPSSAAWVDSVRYIDVSAMQSGVPQTDTQDGKHIVSTYDVATNTLTIEVKERYAIDTTARTVDHPQYGSVQIAIDQIDLATQDTRWKAKTPDAIMSVAFPPAYRKQPVYLWVDLSKVQPWEQATGTLIIWDAKTGSYEVTITRDTDGKYAIWDIISTYKRYTADEVSVQVPGWSDLDVSVVPDQEIYRIQVAWVEYTMDPKDPEIQEQLRIFGFARWTDRIQVKGETYALELVSTSWWSYKLELVPLIFDTVAIDPQWHGGIRVQDYFIQYSSSKNSIILAKAWKAVRNTNGTYSSTVASRDYILLPANVDNEFYTHVTGANGRKQLMKCTIDQQWWNGSVRFESVHQNIVGFDPDIILHESISGDIVYDRKASVDTLLSTGKITFHTTETLQDQAQSPIDQFTLNLSDKERTQLKLPNASIVHKHRLADGTILNVTIHHQIDGQRIGQLRFAFQRTGTPHLERNQDFADLNKDTEMIAPIDLKDTDWNKIELTWFDSKLWKHKDLDASINQQKVIDRCRVDHEWGTKFDIEYETWTWIHRDIISLDLNKAVPTGPNTRIVEWESGPRLLDCMRSDDATKKWTFEVRAEELKDAYGRVRGKKLVRSVRDMPNVRPYGSDGDESNPDPIEDAQEKLKNRRERLTDPDSDPEVTKRDDYRELRRFDHAPTVKDAYGNSIEATWYISTIYDLDNPDQSIDGLYLDDDPVPWVKSFYVKSKHILLDKAAIKFNLNGKKAGQEYAAEQSNWLCEEWAKRTWSFDVDGNGVVTVKVRIPSGSDHANTGRTTITSTETSSWVELPPAITNKVRSPFAPWVEFPNVRRNIDPKTSTYHKGWWWSNFGYRMHPIHEVVRRHKGIDIILPKSTKVYPVLPWKVLSAGFQWTYWKVVVIDHGNGIHTLYAHLDNIPNTIKPWTTIDANTSLWTIWSSWVDKNWNPSSSGPHLHFELKLNGKEIHPKSLFTASKHPDIRNKIPDQDIMKSSKKTTNAAPNTTNTTTIETNYKKVQADIEDEYKKHPHCPAIKDLGFTLNDIKAIAFVESGFDKDSGNDGLYQFQQNNIDAINQNPTLFPPLTDTEAKNFTKAEAKKDTKLYTRAVLWNLHYKSNPPYITNNAVANDMASKDAQTLVELIKNHLWTKLNQNLLKDHSDNKLDAFIRILKDTNSNQKLLKKADTLAAYNAAGHKLDYALSVLYAGYCGFAM
jgi:murein DD-endopeptidase MepM/ murein hydrolase activator NlpD